MPRTGERLASELTWQEELGIEPVCGYPDVQQMTNDEVIAGLVVYEKNRNNATGYLNKFWALYRDEFFRRMSSMELKESMVVSVAQRLLKLSDFIEDIRGLTNKKI